MSDNSCFLIVKFPFIEQFNTKGATTRLLLFHISPEPQGSFFMPFFRCFLYLSTSALFISRILETEYPESLFWLNRSVCIMHADRILFILSPLYYIIPKIILFVKGAFQQKHNFINWQK